MVNDGRTKGGKKMKIEMTEKYDELWDRVLALDYSPSRALLCFLMGFCKDDKHFLVGVRAGLVLYSPTKEEAVKEGK